VIKQYWGQKQSAALHNHSDISRANNPNNKKLIRSDNWLNHWSFKKDTPELYVHPVALYLEIYIKI
jgi:hypothetical protein